MKFSRILRQAMFRSGVNRQELARKTGLTEAAICNFLGGKRLPYYPTLLKLVAACSGVKKGHWVGGFKDDE